MLRGEETGDEVWNAIHGWGECVCGARKIRVGISTSQTQEMIGPRVIKRQLLQIVFMITVESVGL